jgi:MraZ protein
VDRLLGSYRFAVDAKGRISIPAPFRKILFPHPGRSGTLTRGYEDCIALYPPDRWDEEEKQLGDLPYTVGNVRLCTREMALHPRQPGADPHPPGAARVGPDREGRAGSRRDHSYRDF